MAGATNDASKLAREVEDLREQQRALSDVLSAIARSEGLQAVLDEVVEACRRLCEADQGALWLLEDDSSTPSPTRAAPGLRSTTASIRMPSIARRWPIARL
jgi:GAF domain-containing protein